MITMPRHEADDKAIEQISDPSSSSKSKMRRVPKITPLFWIVKVLTTALGESASDYLVHAVNPAIAVGFGPSDLG